MYDIALVLKSSQSTVLKSTTLSKIGWDEFKTIAKSFLRVIDNRHAKTAAAIF